jgi:hypothetical protein
MYMIISNIKASNKHVVSTIQHANGYTRQGFIVSSNTKRINADTTRLRQFGNMQKALNNNGLHSVIYTSEPELVQ